MKNINKIFSDISPSKYFLLTFLILGMAIIDTFIVAAFSTLLSVPLLIASYPIIKTILGIVFFALLFFQFKTLKSNIIYLISMTIIIGILFSVTTGLTLLNATIGFFCTLGLFSILFYFSLKFNFNLKKVDLITSLGALLLLITGGIFFFFNISWALITFYVIAVIFILLIIFKEFLDIKKLSTESSCKSINEILYNIVISNLRSLYIGFMAIMCAIISML